MDNKNKRVKVSEQLQEVDFPTETDAQSHDASLVPVNPISLIKNAVFTRDKA